MKFPYNFLHPIFSPIDITPHMVYRLIPIAPPPQMISDPYSRGSAWTRALLGLPAGEVHLCGDASALELVKKMCHDMGEELVASLCLSDDITRRYDNCCSWLELLYVPTICYTLYLFLCDTMYWCPATINIGDLIWATRPFGGWGSSSEFKSRNTGGFKYRWLGRYRHTKIAQ